MASRWLKPKLRGGRWAIPDARWAGRSSPSSAAAVTPVLLSSSETFGTRAAAHPDVACVDLWSKLGVGPKPSGNIVWELRFPTGTSVASRWNYTSQLTADDYAKVKTGSGSVGRTPSLNSTGFTGTYSWEYRCQVNSGPFSEWVTLTYICDNTACSIGNDYNVSYNYPGAVLDNGTAATWYTTSGGRYLLLQAGLSRPHLELNAGFTFTTSGTRVTLKWADTTRAVTLSNIRIGTCSGILVDLEYAGRMYGFRSGVTGKIQLDGNYNKVIRCDLRNTEADFTAEYIPDPTPPAVTPVTNVWAGIQIDGDDCEVGTEGNDDHANLVHHTFYGIVINGDNSKVCNNVIAFAHARHIGHSTTSDNKIVRGNILLGWWRTRYPTQDIVTHQDGIWSLDNVGGNVEQNPTIENNMILHFGGNASARPIVIGSSGASLSNLTPTIRGNIVISPNTYFIEMFRWSGAARIEYNMGLLSLNGADYSGDVVPPDPGNAAAMIWVEPASALPGGSTLSSDKNWIWRQRNYNAVALAATSGTDIENARATPTDFTNVPNPVAYLEGLPASTWTPPANSTEMATMRGVVWYACRRSDDYSPVNAAGTGWKALP